MPEPIARGDDAKDERALVLVGETRLLAMLLTEALYTLAGRQRGVAHRRARTWVCARDPEGRFSFDQACSAFGLEPSRVRRRVGMRAQVPCRRGARGFRRGPSL